MMELPEAQRPFSGIRSDGHRSFNMNDVFEADCTISILLSRISCLDSDGASNPKNLEALHRLSIALDSWHALLPPLDSVPPTFHRYYHYLEYVVLQCRAMGPQV